MLGYCALGEINVYAGTYPHMNAHTFIYFCYYFGTVLVRHGRRVHISGTSSDRDREEGGRDAEVLGTHAGGC